MIPTNDITAWAHSAPWPSPDQVEQDLLLSQLICLIAADDYLGDELVFRGGTCLHKLYLHPARRYSEDLDCGRRTAGGIGKVTRAISDIGANLGYEVRTKMSAQPKVYLRYTAESRHHPQDQGWGRHPRTLSGDVDRPPALRGDLELVERAGRRSYLQSCRAGRDQDPRALPAA